MFYCECKLGQYGGGAAELFFRPSFERHRDKFTRDVHVVRNRVVWNLPTRVPRSTTEAARPQV